MSIEPIKTSSDVQNQLFTVLTEVSNGKYNSDFLNSLDGDLSKLGMNSLTFIKLLVQIEKRFKLEIDFEVIPMETLNSLPEFTSYLYENSPIVIQRQKELS